MLLKRKSQIIPFFNAQFEEKVKSDGPLYSTSLSNIFLKVI